MPTTPNRSDVIRTMARLRHPTFGSAPDQGEIVSEALDLLGAYAEVLRTETVITLEGRVTGSVLADAHPEADLDIVNAHFETRFSDSRVESLAVTSRSSPRAAPLRAGDVVTLSITRVAP